MAYGTPVRLSLDPRSLVDAFASQPHYFDHIIPFWDALPESVRGTFYVGPVANRPGERTKAVPPGGPVLLAGHPDFGRARNRPIIMVEHGAGETWGSTSPSYPGGPGREKVILFLCPNQRVAEANARYGVPTPIVGSPRLELLRGQLTPQRHDHLRVVVSFHWENTTWPQTRSAYTFYRDHLKHWASQVDLKGHGHPRWIDKLSVTYAGFGIETIREFSDVVAWADVYAVDNSSTLFEAAALGLDVVLLDAPWYEPYPTSLRFDYHKDIGPHVKNAEEFLDAVNTDHSRYSDARQRMVTEIFGTADLDLATEAIIESVTHGNLGSTSSRPRSPA